MEQTAQGGLEFPIPESVQERTGRGTQCSGLSDMVGINQKWIDPGGLFQTSVIVWVRSSPSCLEHAWEQEMTFLNYSGHLVSGQSSTLLIGLVCLSFLLSVHPLC